MTTSQLVLRIKPVTAEERIGTFAPQAVYHSSAGRALAYPQALLLGTDYKKIIKILEID
jgi:hypothetical protein